MPSCLLFSVKIAKGGSGNKRGNEVFEFGYAELPSIFYKNKHNFKEKSFCVEKTSSFMEPPFPLGKGPLEYSEWVVLLSLYVKNGENEVQIHFFVLPLRLIFE